MSAMAPPSAGTPPTPGELAYERLLDELAEEIYLQLPSKPTGAEEGVEETRGQVWVMVRVLAGLASRQGRSLFEDPVRQVTWSPQGLASQVVAQADPTELDALLTEFNADMSDDEIAEHLDEEDAEAFRRISETGVDED